MSRLNRPLLAVALLAFASLARAESLRLAAPAKGTTLRGGSFAELRWSAAQLPAGTEEWEAFLSIDGGKYYAFRVTPHLDIDRQRFTFIVPNVDTGRARILIRTGDEVHETHFESQDFFSIARDAHAEPIVPGLLQFGHGEAARDGDPAVLAWADGARDGSGVKLQSSTSVPHRSLESLAPATSDGPAVVAPASNVLVAPSIGSEPRVDRDKYAPRAEARAVSVDLLLVCSRWNI